MSRAPFVPQVLADGSRPLLVFRKGRTKFHAVAARETDIALVALDSLRGLRELTRKGEPYPAKRCASFWLNHDYRPMAKRARQVLRALVARKPREGAAL
jgi:hypothetical protein